MDLAEFATLFQSKKEFAAGLSLLAEFAYGANKRGVLSEYIATIGQETQNKLDIATITSNSNGTNANDMIVGSTGADTLYGGNGKITIPIYSVGATERLQSMITTATIRLNLKRE